MTEIREHVRAVLPERMLGRPVDHRGYPVPWFVTERDEKGNWEFRVLHPLRYREALIKKVCWICGQALTKRLAFAVGPMCGVNRISAEPPQHLECALFAVKACPFMLFPNSKRREHGLPEDKLEHPASILRNPGVILVWLTKRYTAIPSGEHVLLQMGRPEALTFWYEGRTATRAEIDESLRTGCPTIERVAAAEGQLPEYQRALDRFTKLLPRA